MNEITIVVPKKKTGKLDKLLKDESVTKFVKSRSGKSYKYELFVTELKTKKLLEQLREELEIHAGKAMKEGYITVSPINLVVPHIEEKERLLELEELILKGAKRFIALDRNYLIFLICSTIIACFGFQTDNLIVLIGAMLINPLMASIMAVSYGVAKMKRNLIYKGLKTELIGIALMLLTSLVFGLLPNPSLGLEKALVYTNFYLALSLAMVIGLVAANSFLTGSFEVFTGVAVSISLLPPLTNSVLLLLAGELVLSINSVFAFIFNLLGMHLSALVFFLIVSRYRAI